MHVVRQDADRNCFEWMALLDGAVDMPQAIDMAHEEVARPVGESHGEEEDTALDLGTNIARHGASLAYSCRVSTKRIRLVGKGAPCAMPRRTAAQCAFAHPTGLGKPIHHAPPLVARLAPFPRARQRFSIASNTRSGVTGRSLNRMPMASAIALVSAGRNAASEPSPASLAPNGPCGSLLSTMPTSMGGESWMVGTR